MTNTAVMLLIWIVTASTAVLIAATLTEGSPLNRLCTAVFNALARPLRWLFEPTPRADDGDRAIAELHRWHAVWERDHPDLLVRASYTEHLPIGSLSRQCSNCVQTLVRSDLLAGYLTCKPCARHTVPPIDPDPDLIEHRPLFGGLVRPYGGKRGGVDTSALIARFNQAKRDGKMLILPKDVEITPLPGGHTSRPGPITDLPQVSDRPAIGAEPPPFDPDPDLIDWELR